MCLCSEPLSANPVRAASYPPPSLCSVQEAEPEEVKVIADAQPPRSAKKGRASASSTPQTGSDKKERKAKHKGQPAAVKANRQTEDLMNRQGKAELCGSGRKG